MCKNNADRYNRMQMDANGCKCIAKPQKYNPMMKGDVRRMKNTAKIAGNGVLTAIRRIHPPRYPTAL